MRMRGVKMAVVDVIIEVFLGGSDIQFKLDVYSVHNKVAGRVCNPIKCAIWNMSIGLFVCEIDELDIEFPGGYNYVHYARTHVGFSYLMSSNSI